METLSSANRFRRTLRSLASADADNINTQRHRPEKEQCLFDIYKKEGDNFFLKRKHKKAVNSYSLALTHQPKNLTVLVARSRCYAKLGQWQHALRDAEGALDMDSAHTPALYQKAQVLYSMEHYDAALLFFHKGHRLNPNAPGFSEGVEKAQKALSRLPPGRRMKTTEIGDISMYIPRRANFTRRYKPIQNCNTDREPEQEPLSPSFRSRQVCKLVSLELQKKSPGSLDRVSQTFQPRTHVPKVRGSNPSSMRDVLSQLYTDKAYFEKILHDMERSDRFNEDVFHLAGDGLAFVAERMLYWATFGTPAPPPCASGSRFKSRKAKRASSHGLQPVLSARQGRCAPVTSVEGQVMTSERGEGETTSGGAGDRAAKAVTWGGVAEESTTNNPQDIETDVNEPRKRNGKVPSEGGKGRNSDDQYGKKQRERKRIKKKTATGGEKGDDATPLSDSDVEKLKFNFDTYRPSPVGSKQQAQRGGIVPPPLVRTVEDLSTDEWDSEWDECEENDNTQPSRSRRHAGGEGETARKNQLTVEGEANTKEETPDPVRLYLLRVIRDIHAEFDKGGYLMVREKVHGVLADLDKYKSEFMADKMDLVATLHSLLGNAYLEIGDLDLAMEHHHQDMCIGQDMKDNSIVSRALGNLGRINVARKHFSAALECFASKSKHVSTPVEKAWLYQEIANCFLKLRHFEFARDAAAKALGIATLARSSLYQLQAAVLLALSEVQLQKYEQAHEHFTLALDQARLREDVKAESSIRSALHQVNAKLAAMARDAQAAVISRPTATDTGKSSMKISSSDDEEDPELADLKDSLEEEEEEEDEELARLKDSDTESVGGQEQQVIQAVSALVARSARSTKQPSPPPKTQHPPGEDSENLVLNDHQQTLQIPAHPHTGELQGSSSLHLGSNLQNFDPQGVNEGEKNEFKHDHSTGGHFYTGRQTILPKPPPGSPPPRMFKPGLPVPRPSRKRLEREARLRRRRRQAERDDGEEAPTSQDTHTPEDSTEERTAHTPLIPDLSGTRISTRGREEGPHVHTGQGETSPQGEPPETPSAPETDTKEHLPDDLLVNRMAVRFRSFVSDTPVTQEHSRTENAGAKNTPPTADRCDHLQDRLSEEGPLTTDKLSEEGPLTTDKLSEEGPLTTDKLSEEGPHTTGKLSEEGPLTTDKEGPHTTCKLTEEGPHTTDKEGPHTTDMLSEEGPLTTDKLSEEGPLITDKLTEEGPHTTDKLSEEGPHTTDKLSEEGPHTTDKLSEDGPHTTDKLSEEGPHTTDKLSEEGPHTTDKLSEEGPHTTDKLSEDGPHTTDKLSEEGPHTTDKLSEEGPHTTDKLSEDGPHTTDKLSEEGPHTTDKLSEEGPHTTDKLSEEGPHTTDKLSEDGPHTTDKEGPHTTGKLTEEGPHTTDKLSEEGPHTSRPESREASCEDRQEGRDRMEGSLHCQQEEEWLERTDMGGVEGAEARTEEAEGKDDDDVKTSRKDDNGGDTAEKEEGAEGEREVDKEDGDEEREDREGEKEEEEEDRRPSVDPILLHLRTELKGIEDALKAEDTEGVMVKAQAALDSYSEEELQEEEYLPLVAKLHSFLGTAAMMEEESEKALHHHQKDLDIGQLIENEEIQSRALENLGRVHVLRKHYDQALQSYVKRLELERDDDTSARVFHEIANCFFHVRHYREAQDAARLAVKHGKLCGDSLIQLQSTVLMAVCHVKDDRSDQACTTFEEALEFALQRDDKEAEEAIRDAIRRLKSKVQLAVDKFKQSLVRGRRMANKFYPLTDWVSHVLLTKESGQGQSLLKGSGFELTDKEPPRWRH